jgi:hypothetical protein
MGSGGIKRTEGTNDNNNNKSRTFLQKRQKRDDTYFDYLEEYVPKGGPAN